MDLSDQFPAIFSRIEYAPVAVVSAGYRREQIQHPANGFGFLVPRAKGCAYLGTVFNSSLFPGRARKAWSASPASRAARPIPDFADLSDDEITGDDLRRSRARPRHYGKAGHRPTSSATRAPCRNTIWAIPQTVIARSASPPLSRDYFLPEIICPARRSVHASSRRIEPPTPSRVYLASSQSESRGGAASRTRDGFSSRTGLSLSRFEALQGA